MEEPQIQLEVSAIVVSYNCATALRRCLTALEASADREKMEILVVDNGSWDGTPEVAAEFPQVVLLKLPRNFGFTKALNIGMRTAKAETYFYLSPQVEVQPETVSALATRLRGEADVVAVCPLVEGAEQQFFALPGPDAAIRNISVDASEEKVAVPVASLAAYMVRAYFLKGLRYVDERYSNSWVDAELAIQIRRAGKKILLFPGTRAKAYPDEKPMPPPAVRTLLASDEALGAATYAAKHFGFGAGLKVRLAAIFGALFGFRIPLLVKLLGGQKIDGTQNGM